MKIIGIILFFLINIIALIALPLSITSYYGIAIFCLYVILNMWIMYLMFLTALEIGKKIAIKEILKNKLVFKTLTHVIRDFVFECKISLSDIHSYLNNFIALRTITPLIKNIPLSDILLKEDLIDLVNKNDKENYSVLIHTYITSHIESIVIPYKRFYLLITLSIVLIPICYFII